MVRMTLDWFVTLYFGHINAPISRSKSNVIAQAWFPATAC